MVRPVGGLLRSRHAMASNDPGWMSGPEAGAAPAQTGAPQAGGGSGVATDRGPMIRAAFKVAHIGLPALMVYTALSDFMHNSGNQTWFIATYIMLFAAMLATFEVAQIRNCGPVTMVLRENFGFLFRPLSKAIFIIFLAFLEFGLDTGGGDSNDIGILCGCLLIVDGASTCRCVGVSRVPPPTADAACASAAPSATPNAPRRPAAGGALCAGMCPVVSSHTRFFSHFGLCSCRSRRMFLALVLLGLRRTQGLCMLSSWSPNRTLSSTRSPRKCIRRPRRRGAATESRERIRRRVSCRRTNRPRVLSSGGSPLSVSAVRAAVRGPQCFGPPPASCARAARPRRCSVGAQNTYIISRVESSGSAAGVPPPQRRCLW